MRLPRHLIVLPMLVLAACAGGRAHRPSPLPTSTAGLASQEFVYRVEENHGEGGTSTTVVIDVADPYVARIVNRNATGMLGGSAWGSSGLLVLAADGSARQVQQTPPGFTGGDTHLDVALPLAASLGWVRKSSPTAVGGRACTRWLSGPPLDSGSIDPATAVERTTSCVDDSGRILSDRWSRNGRVVRVRTLLSTGPGPRLSPDGLDPGSRPSPLPSTTAAQLARAVDAAKLAPLMGISLPAPPPGQRLDRSTAIVVQGSDGSAREEGASFTYVGAGRLTVVTFTRYLVGAATAPTRGQPVQLARATGRVLPVVEGLEADLVTRTGLAVKVQSDLPLPVLTTWLRHLILR